MKGSVVRRSWLLVGLLIASSPAILWGGVDAPCRWRVVRARAVGPKDTPFVERHVRLVKPETLTNVAGPDSLRIEVRASEENHAELFIVDPQAGTSQFLATGSAPRSSKDGKCLAFTRWTSDERPWTLVILDLEKKRETLPDLNGCAAHYEWSPDGKWLAVMVTPCQAPKSLLCLVAVPSGTVHWMDSLTVFSDYEFGWSPDSRRLAVVRPTKIDPHPIEEPTDADVWIFTIDGSRCLLKRTPDYVEHAPQWITNRLLLIERYRVEDSEYIAEDRVVLEVEG